MSNNNDLGYMRELIWYMELRAKAQMKGIDVLAEVNEPQNLHNALAADNGKYNYAVVKRIGSIYFSIDEDGGMYLDCYHDGDCRSYTVGYTHSFTEAEKIVENYNENFANLPKFYGFIRQYENEPQEILDYQVMALNHFAEKYSIQYETIFGCRGGYAEEPHTAGSIEDTFNIPCINNVQESCGRFFTDMAKNSGILCIADRSRLDGDYRVWKESMDIIEVDRVQYNYCNIADYRECKPEQENECIQENVPEQGQCIPEHERNSVPGDIPGYISEQKYKYTLEQEDEDCAGDVSILDAPFGDRCGEQYQNNLNNN